MKRKGKRKLHFILTRLPYPPFGGDRLKSHNLIKILHKYFNLHIIVISDEKPTKESEEFMNEYSIHYKLFTFSKWRFWLNAAMSIFNNHPIQTNYYTFSAVSSYLKKHVDKEDLIICNLIRTAQYGIPYNNVKLLDIVDSISINYRRSIDKVDSYFWKFIYRIEMNRVAAFEKKCLKEFNSTFYVNLFEADYWKQYGKTAWIPNGVNNDLLHYHYFPDPKYKNVVTFFGKMDYQPNVDAVKWFVEKCLPYIHKDYSFLIVGIHPSKVITRLASKHERVSYTGFVSDPYFILASSGIVVAPMQTGGGIQNKILEAMALGTVVVTTELGGKPIKGAINGEHLLIENDPYKMAELINDILGDRESYDVIGAQAKNLIQSNFTWEIYEQRLKKLFEELGVDLSDAVELNKTTIKNIS